MAKNHAPWLRLAAGSLLAALSACGEHDANDGTAELLEADETIAALRASGAEAQAAASACFDAFETCKAAAGADEAACRDQLKACLPARAPRGHDCGDAGAPADSGAAPAPTTPDAGAHKDRDSDGGRPTHGGDGGRPERDPDAGSPFGGRGPNGGGDRGGDHGGNRGGDHGHSCGGGHFDGPDRGLGACRDMSAGAMQGGMSTSGVRAQHQACALQAFNQILAKLCSKATALCGQPDAPAEVCARVTAACSALPQPDAGP